MIDIRDGYTSLFERSTPWRYWFFKYKRTRYKFIDALLKPDYESDR
jgi:hypothetical protein